MRTAIALFLLAISGCAAPPPVAVAPRSAAVQLARQEVEQAVVKRFGEAALARARNADEFVAALRYPGLPLPPHDTDGTPIEPFYPTALLYRDKGRWFAYGMDGLHPVLPRWSQQLESVLRDPRLFSEPVDGGFVGCTDAGASYAWMKVEGRAEQARIGHCGGSPVTEQLVSAALMG